MPIPPFDSDTRRLPTGEHAASWDEVLIDLAGTPLVAVNTDRLDPTFFDLAGVRQEQKRRFFGELLPDWTESGSRLRFAEFFQRDRVHGFKGIVVFDPRSIHS